jgi:hypothetical protein
MDLGPPISGASLGAVVGIMVAVMSSPSSNKGAQIGGYALAGAGLWTLMDSFDDGSVLEGILGASLLVGGLGMAV